MKTKSLLCAVGLCMAMAAAAEPPHSTPAVAATPASSAPAHLSKPGAPVRVRFDVKERPEVGRPLAVDIAIAPQAASETLRYTIRTPEGLTALRGANTKRLSKVSAGAEFHDTLTVIPQENGRYILSVVVVMDSANGPLARVFALPIDVGVTAAQSLSSKPAPAVDSTGQKIESMPAQRIP